MYRQYGLFIDGSWRRASDGGTAPVLSPVTETPLGDAPAACPADTEEALQSAARGLAGWRAKSAFERADAIHKIADEMVRRTDQAVPMLSTETGKPLAQSEREWGLSVDQFRWYAEEARRVYSRVIASRVT